MFFVQVSVAQICSEIKNIKNQLDFYYNKPDKDSLKLLLQKIPHENGICQQEYFAYQVKYYHLEKQLDSANFYLNRLTNSLLKNYNEKLKLQEIYLRGQHNYYTENNDSATSCYIMALDKASYLKDTLMQIKILGSLANVFGQLTQYDKAIQYASTGLHLSQIKQDLSSEIFLLGNLCSFYGRNYMKTKQAPYLDSATLVSKTLIPKAKVAHKTRELLKAFSVLSTCFLQNKNYKLSLIYSDSVLLFGSRVNNLKQICSAFFNICDVHLELKNPTKAKLAADSAMFYAKKTNDTEVLMNSYYKLYDCSNEMNDYKSALTYYLKYKELNDSINYNDQSLLVNELEQKYNKVKNEKTIKELSQEKDLLKQKEEINGLQIKFLVVAIIFIVVVIIAVILFYRQRSLKQKQILLQAEQRLNRSRINPHFFFNAMGALQSIILNDTDKQKLIRNFTSFSKLMRQTLESSYNEFISIEKELEFLNHYLSLQLIRKENAFVFKTEIDEAIEQEEVVIPAMLLQPFVENSIEHGFKALKEGGELVIKFTKQQDKLIITIYDNGQGITNEKTDSKHISRATQITKDRLFLLNKLLKADSSFEIDSSKNVGTEIKLTLPFLYKHEISNH